MADLIDRQAALDTIMGQPPEPHYPSWYAAQIEKLPAAQPATNCSEIPNSSDDTISRQAAIDLFPDDDLEYDTKGGYVAPHLARRMICELPSAQPQSITCDGCKHVGTYDTDFPCSSCIRREKDYYEPDE